VTTVANASAKIRLTCPHDLVVRVFERESTMWLSAFLRLATHREESVQDPYRIPEHRYQLGPVVTVGPRTRAGLIWWPDLEGEPFQHFAGDFRIERTGSGTDLTLAGAVADSEAAAAEEVLDHLVRLIGSALTATQCEETHPRSQRTVLRQARPRGCTRRTDVV
jgi:hypothetical protein